MGPGHNLFSEATVAKVEDYVETELSATPELQEAFRKVAAGYKRRSVVVGAPLPQELVGEEGADDDTGPVEDFAEEIRAAVEVKAEDTLRNKDLAKLYEDRPYNHQKHGESRRSPTSRPAPLPL